MNYEQEIERLQRQVAELSNKQEPAQALIPFGVTPVNPVSELLNELSAHHTAGGTLKKEILVTPKTLAALKEWAAQRMVVQGPWGNALVVANPQAMSLDVAVAEAFSD